MPTNRVFTVSVCVITLLIEPYIFLLSSFNNSKISDKYVNDSPKKSSFVFANNTLCLIHIQN